MSSSSESPVYPSGLIASEGGAPVGLRARQKQARSELLLNSAQRLFNSSGFDATTMAAIAVAAEVSTPTVFNYFKTKDELLLALVLRVHQQTRIRVSEFQASPAGSTASAIAEFLGLYSKMSLQAISRETWRHVEATCIRLPDSGFVKQYDALTDEMLQDFVHFLGQFESTPVFAEQTKRQAVAAILFNHWGRLFINLVRDDEMSLEQHQKHLLDDLAALLG